MEINRDNQRQTDHVSIEVNQRVSAEAEGDTVLGTAQLASCSRVSGNDNEYNVGYRGAPISTIIIRDLTPFTVQSTTTAPAVAEGSKLFKQKCMQCCWPMSISCCFIGLGRFLTGFNFIVELSKYCGSNSLVDGVGGSPSIPFENLQTETPPLPQEQNCAPVDGNAANANETSHHQSTCNSSPEIHIKFQFPFFIVLISISQYVFFHYVMNQEYEGWFSTYLEFNPLKRYQIWRFITAVWIHGTAAHLRANLRLQLIAGVCLEVVHGWKRVGKLYFGGVLFANLTTSVVEPFLRAYGASGGVYAILTGHLASNLINWKETWGASIRCLLICIYLAFSILVAVLNINVGHHLPLHHLVGHAAHLGGALSGLLIGLFVLKNFRENMIELKRATICRNIAIVLIILAVGANIGDQIFLGKALQAQKLQRNQMLMHMHLQGNQTNIHNNSIASIRG